MKKRKKENAVDVPMTLLLREIALYAREHRLLKIYCKEMKKRENFLSNVLNGDLSVSADDVGILALDKVVKEVRGALSREAADAKRSPIAREATHKRLQRLDWLAEQVRRELF